MIFLSSVGRAGLVFRLDLWFIMWVRVWVMNWSGCTLTKHLMYLLRTVPTERGYKVHTANPVISPTLILNLTIRLPLTVTPTLTLAVCKQTQNAHVVIKRRAVCIDTDYVTAISCRVQSDNSIHNVCTHQHHSCSTIRASSTVSFGSEPRCRVNATPNVQTVLTIRHKHVNNKHQQMHRSTIMHCAQPSWLPHCSSSSSAIGAQPSMCALECMAAIYH